MTLFTHLSVKDRSLKNQSGPAALTKKKKRKSSFEAAIVGVLVLLAFDLSAVHICR